MPIVKRNYSQLVEWKTKKYFMDKGYIPTGEAINLQPSSYAADTAYFSPYELRPMTDEEWSEYIQGTKKRKTRPTKPIKTAIDLLLEEYNNAKEDSEQETAENIVIAIEDKNTPFMETHIKIYNKKSNLLLDMFLPILYTRIKKANFIHGYDAPFGSTLLDDDTENIRAIIDIEKLLDKGKISKLKTVLIHAKTINHLPPKYEIHYLTFRELLNQ